MPKVLNAPMMHVSGSATSRAAKTAVKIGVSLPIVICTSTINLRCEFENAGEGGGGGVRVTSWGFRVKAEKSLLQACNLVLLRYDWEVQMSSFPFNVRHACMQT